MQPKGPVAGGSVVLGTYAASAWVSGELALPVWIRSTPNRCDQLPSQGRSGGLAGREVARKIDGPMTAGTSGNAHVREAGRNQAVHAK
jgi:hypothetical protein